MQKNLCDSFEFLCDTFRWVLIIGETFSRKKRKLKLLLIARIGFTQVHRQ